MCKRNCGTRTRGVPKKSLQRRVAVLDSSDTSPEKGNVPSGASGSKSRGAKRERRPHVAGTSEEGSGGNCTVYYPEIFFVYFLLDGKLQ